MKNHYGKGYFLSKLKFTALLDAVPCFNALNLKPKFSLVVGIYKLPNTSKGKNAFQSLGGKGTHFAFFTSNRPCKTTH